MRHREVVERQIALATTLRSAEAVLRDTTPAEVWATMTPETRRLTTSSPQYVAVMREYRRMADALDACDAWHVQPSICELVEVAAHDLPRWTTLREELLPAPFGFLLFDDVIRLERAAVEGFAWRLLSPDEARGYGQAGGVLYLWLNEAHHRPRFEAVAMGWGQEIGTRWKPHVHAAAAIIMTTWHLIEQEVVSAEPSGPVTANRQATRRLLAASGRKRIPDVRVVQLRPRGVARDDGDEKTDGHRVPWSHRWLVRGHWRRQWYPSRREHRPLWIAPYVKGPGDKPLRVRRTVVNVQHPRLH